MNKTMKLVVLATLLGAALVAQAFGVDIAQFSTPEAAAGLLVFGGMGNLDVINKSLDKLEVFMGDIKTDQREFSDRLTQLEQRGTPFFESRNPAGESLGALVAKQFADNSDAFMKHRTLALKIETKSIGSALTGLRDSLAPTPGSDTQVLTNLLPKLQMKTAGGAAALIYPRRSVAITGPGASAIAEDGARPQSEPLFVSITQPLVTIAAYSVLNESALRTTGELQSAIDLHLRADINRAADTTLISGGTGFASGFLGLATAFVVPFAGSNALLEETISICAMDMRAAGYQPNVVVVNPTDWRGVYLRRDTTNGYIHGTPLAVPPLIIAGMEVVFSSAVTTAQAMLLDSRYCDLLPLEQIRIELAYSGTQFTTGEITVRGELQGIPVVRDLSAIKLASRAAS